MPRINSNETRKSCNRGHWKPAEDERLKQLVEQYGPQNWNFIAEHLHGRSGKSCRLRWYNQLDPNIVKRPFTEEEEEMLLTLHKVKGNKWAAISRFLPGRTDNAVKNHFHVLMARRKRDHFTLFGERSIHENNPNSNNHQHHHHIPILDSTSMNKPNMSIFGMSSSSSHSLLSSITSNLGNKAQNNDYSSGSSSTHGSCMLGSYNSFTAPGIPSIGKIVPLPNRFSSSNSTNYGQRIENFSIKSKKNGKNPYCDNRSLGFSELPNMEEEQVEKIKVSGSTNVSFIDFLGVGSDSGP